MFMSMKYQKERLKKITLANIRKRLFVDKTVDKKVHSPRLQINCCVFQKIQEQPFAVIT